MKLTKEQIKFLNKVCRGDWTLNSKGEVDVDGYVSMSNIKLTEIPVKFDTVSGAFECSCARIKTLNNFPNLVGSVNINSCQYLTSIENLQTTIKTNEQESWKRSYVLNITSNRNLKSLKGIENIKIVPNENGLDNFYVRLTENDLTSLEYIPTFLDNNPSVKNINLYGNKNLKDYFNFIDKDNFKYWDKIYFSIIYDYPNLFPYIYPHLNESDKGNFKRLLDTNQHLKLYI